MTAIPVVIVSTNALTRAGLQQIIAQSETRIEVLGLFDGLSEANTYLKEHRVRVLIADESPQYANMTRDLKRLIETHPGTSIILVMQRPTASLCAKLIAIGVRALLHKDDDLATTLNKAIEMAVSGNMTISPRIAPFLDKAASLPAR